MFSLLGGALRAAAPRGFRLVAFTVALAAGMGCAMLVGLTSSQATTPAQNITGGHTLLAGQELESPGGQYLLKLVSTGNLQELTGAGQVLWSTTNGTPGDHALLQPNGNLVLIDGHGQTLWSSNTRGTGCPSLDVQRDGNVVLYDTAAVWQKGAIHGLTDGQYLYPGWVEYAPGGEYYLVMQTDGNLVLYNDANQWKWQSKTNGNPGAWATLQTDGNLVVYSKADKPLWSSATAGHPGDSLAVQSDGNMVIYPKTGTWLWQSYTHGATNDGRSVDLPGPAASAKPCPTPPPAPPPVQTVTAPPVTETTTMIDTTTTVETVPVPAPRPRHLRVHMTVRWSWSGPVTRLDRVTIGKLPRHASFAAVYEHFTGHTNRRHREAFVKHGQSASARRRLESVVRWLKHTVFHPKDRLVVTISRRRFVPERATFTIRNGHEPKLSR